MFPLAFRPVAYRGLLRFTANNNCIFFGGGLGFQLAAIGCCKVGISNCPPFPGSRDAPETVTTPLVGG